MARSQFGGGVEHFVAGIYNVGGNKLPRLVSATLYAWDAETDGTRVTDLLVDGQAAATVTADANGQIPTFEGPDGVTTLWLSAGETGDRFRFTSQDEAALQAARIAAEDARDAAVAAVAGVPATTDAAMVAALQAPGSAAADEVNARAQQLVDALKGAAPAAFDTLVEIASKLAADDDVTASILAGLGDKLDTADVDAVVAAEAGTPGSELGQVLSATYAPHWLTTYGGNRFVFLGDSMTAGVVNGDSWPQHAAIRSNQRIRYVRNAGVSGNRTDQMIARLQADVLDHEPDACTVLAGINDIINGYTVQQIRANLTIIYETLTDNGIKPVLCTILPNTTTDATRKTKIQALNAWIKDYASANTLDLIDFYGRYVDAATGDFAAGVSSDNLHPDLKYPDMGQFVADTLTARLPTGTPHIAQDAAATGWNVLPNPMFLTDANADGVPDSWLGVFGTAGQYAHSLVTDAAIQGRWAQIVMTAATGSRQLAYSATGRNPTWASPGDRVALACRVDFTATGDTAPAEIYMRGTSGIFTQTNAVMTRSAVAGLAYVEYVLPSNWDGRIDFYMVAPKGNGTYKVAQPTLYNLTRMKAYTT